MIMTRITGGLANQIFEYMTAYALSVKYDVELILDVSETASQFRGFLLDELNIPDYRKVYYDYKPANVGDLYIHEDILKNYTICVHYLYAKGNNITTVPFGKLLTTFSLEEIGECIKNGENVYIYGSFDEKALYLKKPYWKDLRAQISMKNPPAIFDKFVSRTNNEETVALHIRRGDYMFVDRVTVPSGDYYRSSISYFRKRLNNPKFYVFTDDAEWASGELGFAEDIFYFSGFGGMDIDICEMFCISKCKYKILSYYSGYSSLADLLNTDKNCITIRGYNDNRSYISFTERAVIDAKLIIKHVIGKFKNRKNTSENPFISIGKKQKLNLEYETVREQRVKSQKLLQAILDTPDDNLDKDFIETIDEFGLDSIFVSADAIKQILRKKFIALVNCNMDESAWLILHKIRFEFDDSDFETAVCKLYERLSLAYGKNEEPVNYIMMPGAHYSDPSVRLHGLTLMGVRYKECGNYVSFIFKPNRFYNHFLDIYEMLTDADKTNYHCRQFKEEKFQKTKAFLGELLRSDCINRIYYEDADSLELINECVDALDSNLRENSEIEIVKWTQNIAKFRMIEIDERLPLIRAYDLELIK